MAADVFISAGEASGDLQAALLVDSVRKLRPRTSFAAVGSSRLRAAGASLVADSSEWASIGPVSALGRVPALYRALRRLEAMLAADPPRLLVTVDFGAFHIRLLQRLRRNGYTGDAVYYFPPGAWLDDPGQARAVAAVSTALTPFAHQRDFYDGVGVRAQYFGHPLVSVIPSRPPPPRHAAPHIAIFPGSRREEVARHLPTLARAAALSQRLSVRWQIVAASPARRAQITAGWKRFGGPLAAVEVTATEQALDSADLAWVASGTAVLEAALRGVVQIAFYRVSELQYHIARRRLPRLVAGPITLPNLVLGRRFIPELLQHRFTPQALAAETAELLASEGDRSGQLRSGAELRAALGPPDALMRIARFVASRLESAPR
ncbi:MAG: hypothetical protein GIW99_11305 [Candidatus Eremiobacteraeota bacterium]|nr:hypothetical protein [Candidatus Eremiobacteraeota bacterium]MBC5828247.1 hypothetical protein [Candidatus Eremiobacteraeota bacterium]